MKVREIVKKIKNKEITAEEVMSYYLNQIESKNAEINAIVEVFDDALLNAKNLDDKISKGEPVGKLAGVPILLKDNILYKGKKSTCASNFMKNYISPYTATCVEKLLSEDAIIIGRANMDEFGMESLNKTSIFGVCKNALDLERTSGGCASAVASGMVPCALGTDTSGSVRQHSSYNGVVGMKPTYGRVSRYGVVADASSLDQVGPITQDVEDNALILSIISGKDSNDTTALSDDVLEYDKYCDKDVCKFKVGIIKEFKENLNDINEFNNLINFLKSKDIEVVEVSIPNIKLSLPIYNVIETAEVSSNLGRYEGIKFGERAENCTDIDDIYKKSRAEGFGYEVKKRILLGNYFLSSSQYQEYFVKSKKIQQKIKEEFELALTNCNVILLPTTLDESFKSVDKKEDVEIFNGNLFTVPASISGIPALSVPYAKGVNSLPLSVQILSKELNESEVYSFASYIEKTSKEDK